MGFHEDQRTRPDFTLSILQHTVDQALFVCRQTRAGDPSVSSAHFAMMSEHFTPPIMQAHLIERFGQAYVQRTVEKPTLQGPFDILVKVKAASFCHTDELLRQGVKRVLPPLPFIGCHELAGEVVEVGPDVSNVLVGDHVGVLTKGYQSCGQCKECNRADDIDDDPGYSVYCPQSQEIGLGVPGGFAEYTVVDSRQTTQIPEGMTCRETAPFMCAGISMYAALKRCRLSEGASVAIIGAGGGLGHLGIQFAHHMGYVVVAVDAADGPLRIIKEVAPRALSIDARKTIAPEAKRLALAHGAGDDFNPGLDAVIILTESQAAFDYGLHLLREGGTCMLVSFPYQGYHLNPLDVIGRKIKIVGSQVGSAKSLREMMEFAAQHDIRSRSKLYCFSDLNLLVEDSHRFVGGKYVLDFSL